MELAASRNHSEGLYCLGSMYEAGEGGLQKNWTKALELFKLSASQAVPWPMALEAIGSHYRHAVSKV
jgi:TPR repeat protein